EACRSAVARLSADVDGLLMICGDIPLISTDAVAALLEAQPPRRFAPPLLEREERESPRPLPSAPLVAIVPDRRHTGTNALLRTPPGISPPCFGADSFLRHLAAARSQGVEVRIVESDALALDIDDLADLDELQRRLDADPTLLSAELREALPRRDEVPAQCAACSALST